MPSMRMCNGMSGKSKMASVENDNELSNNNIRIDCRCRRSLLYIMQCIEKKIENIFQGRNVTQLLKIFKAAILSSILIDGHVFAGDLPELDMMAEPESHDTSKEHYLEHVLMTKFDTQVVKTTQLRKLSTSQVRSKLKKLIRVELKYLVLVDVPSNVDSTATERIRSDRCCISEEPPISLNNVHERLQRSAEQSALLLQNSKDMIKQCGELSKAISFYKKFKCSDIMRVVHDSPPPTPKCCKLLDSL